MNQYKQDHRLFLLALALVVLTGALPALQAKAQCSYTPEAKIVQYSSRVVGLASFYTPDNKNESVIAGTEDGWLHEVYYRQPGQPYDTLLGYFYGLSAATGFYANDDQNRIAIVGTADGTLSEVFYHPNRGIGRSIIASFPGTKIVSVAAFYNAFDHHRIAYAALTDGSIWEVDYHPSVGIRKTLRAQFYPGMILAIAANSANDNRTRRFLVSSGYPWSVGRLTEYRISNLTNVVTAINTLVTNYAYPFTSLSAIDNSIIAANSRLGAGYFYQGTLHPSQLPGVELVAFRTPNLPSYVYSRGGAINRAAYYPPCGDVSLNPI